MSLATNVSDLATAVGTQVKADRVVINGNDGTGATRLATAATTLVDAINEVNAATGSAAGISDGTTTTTTTWSSSKISDQLDGKAATSHTQAISTVTGLQTALDGKAATSHTQAISTITGLQGALDAKAVASHTHTSANITDLSSTIGAATAAMKNEILGGAAAAYDTLGELQTLIGDNSDLIASLETVAANKVSFETQTLTAPQQTQARTNIGAASAADLTALSTNTGTLANGSAVAALEAALV